MTTFALSSIGNANAGSSAAAAGAAPGTSAAGGASAFDMLLQDSSGNAPAATGGGGGAGPSSTASSSGGTTSDGAKSASAGTTADGTGAATRKSPAADDASDNTDGNPMSSGTGVAVGASQPAGAADGTTNGAATNGAAASTADAETPAFDPKLLHDLTSALAELEADEKNGVAPSKDLLKRLQQAVDALSGYLAALQPGAALALAGAPAEATSRDGAGSGVSGVSGASAALNQVLRRLADAATAGPGTGSTATGDAGGPALARLADKLDALSSALAQSQPTLSGDLDHLAEQIQQASIDGLKATTAPAKSAAPPAAATGDPTKASATAGPASNQLAAVPLQATTPRPADAKDAGATKHDNTKVDGDPSAPTDAKPVADKASAGKDAPGDAKKDATAGAPTSVGAGSAPTPSAPTSTTAAQGAAIALTSAQPTAGPAAAAAQQAQAAYQAADTAPVNLPQMAFEIARQVQHGTSEFQIRLDPADLGRVNVTLAVDATGNVSAHLAVERADTLALLRQDANNLNQALAQAGLAGGKTNLQFSLSQNPFARQDNGGQPTNTPPAPAGDEQSSAPIPIAPAITRYRGSLATSNLNIFV